MDTSFYSPLLLLFISVGISVLIRQGNRQAERTESVRDAMAEQKVVIARLDERFCSVEARVEELRAKRNDEQARVFTLAADALIELRNERRARERVE